MKKQRAVIAIVSICAGGLFASALEGQMTTNPLLPRTLYHTYIVCIKGGHAVSGCPVTVTGSAVLNTNGHFHNRSAYHPSSGLCKETASSQCTTTSAFSQAITGNTDSSGTFYFAVYTTLVGQTEELTYSSSDQTYSLPPADTLSVGYTDLVAATTNPAWVLVGGSTTGHGDNTFNHYMTQATFNALVATTNAWANATGNCQICTNDEALESGGKFDICALQDCPSSKPAPYGQEWNDPHSTHDRGTAVDINSSGHQGCQVPVNIQQFIQTCVINGFRADSSFIEADHPHCGTMNSASYPH